MAREYNMISKHANGKSINVTDGETGNLTNLTIYGENNQKNLLGVNLIDFGNLSVANTTSTFQNDVLTVVGSSSGTYTRAQVDITDLYKNNPGKTLRFDYANYSSTVSGIYGVNLQVNRSGTNTYPTLQSNTGSLSNHTIPSDTSDITTVYLRIMPNNTNTAQANTLKYTKPMLHFGTSRLDYEPYCGTITSPNPSYPQEIGTISGDNTLIVTGKNILNPYFNNSYLNGYTANGMTITYNQSDQTYTFNGTCTTDNTTFQLGKEDVDFTSGLTTVSAHWISGSVTNYCIFRTFNSNYSISTNVNLVNLSSSNTVVSSTYSSTATPTYTAFANGIGIRFNNGSVANNLKVKFMIANDTDTTYEAYNNSSTKYPIYLGVEEILDVSTFAATTTLNGITYTNNGDGTFSLSGTASANTTIRIVPIGSLNLETNQAYYLYSSKAYNNNTFNMSIVMNENGTNRYLTANSTYTTPSTFTAARLQFYIANGQTVNAPNVKMSLVKGTTYNHSKSTQIELAALNVYNLCDSSQRDLTYANGITYTRNSDGSITANGTATGTSYIDISTKQYPKGTYYLSGCPADGSSSSYQMKMVNTNGWTDAGIDDGNGVSFNPNGTDVYSVRIRIANGYTANDITFYPQLEIGSTKHEYTPYGTPLPIYRDKLYSKGNKWYVHKEIGKVILNGNEDWHRTGTKTSGNYYFYVDNVLSNILYDSNNRFTAASNIGITSNAYQEVQGIDTIYYDNKNRTRVYTEVTKTMSLSNFESWVSNNKIITYYALATPTETEITDAELISQLNDIKTITGRNEITLQSSTGAKSELDFYYKTSGADDYYQALIDNTATIETIVNVLPLSADEEIINLNEENSVINWTHSDFRYVQNTEDKSQEGFIGQFVARTFDGKVIDLDDNFNIENHEIEVYLGIVNEEDTGYISLGNFIIESIERDEVDDTTSFKSSDYTMFFNQKFNGDYTDSTFTDSFNTKIQNGETVTALWLAQYTCAQVGVVLGHSDFTNYDYVIASNQFDDQHTCRDVIKSIAKLAYSWARIGWDNKLYFDFTVDTEVNTDLNVITNENYYNLETQKEEIGEINKVILGSSIVSGNNQYIEDSASIEANGEHAIEIYDNPITYNDDTKIAALENGDVLYGLHYRPLSTLTTGHPWLQGNELIEIVDMEGNSIYTYPFDRTIEYNGHIKTKLDSYGATAVESTQSYYEGTDNIAKQTKVELDRQNQRLTVAISELTGEIQDVSDEFNTLVEPSKTVRGNPIEINDAGEYMLKKFGLYGHSEQDETGSIDEPSEVNSVSGEHTLTIRSKNMFRALPASITKSGVTMNIQDNVISLNGTHPDGGEIYYINNWQKEDESENDYFTLQPGTYTITGIIDDLPEGGLPRILFVDRENSVISNANLYEDEWIQSGDTFIQSVTFTINDIAEKACFTLDTRLTSVKTFNISSLRLQLEKGSESTPYGQYIEPQEFIYDLNDIELCSIGTYKDSITYNITDEKWYLNRNVGYFLSVDGIPYSNVPSSTNCAMIYLYDENENLMFYDGDLLQLDIPIQNILSDKLEYKGFVTDIEDIYDEEGLYVCQLNQPPGSPYSKTILPIAMILKSRFNKTPSDFIYHEDITPWAQTENIKVYYPLNNQLTEELTDYDLVVQLNEILEKAKTYPTDIIIEDSANTGGTETELEITYMLDTEFNGNYATRTELQVTQNSISTVVADTVSTTLDPITLGLEDLGDRINTVEGNLQGDIDELRGDLGDYALQTDVVTLERSVTELQTSTAEVISVAKSLQLNGVEKVRTSTDYTFDENGLMIAKTGAATKTQVTENGMSIYSTAGSSDEAMLTVNSQGVDAYNVKVGTYLLIGTHARMQDYEDGTGVFYIG